MQIIYTYMCIYICTDICSEEGSTDTFSPSKEFQSPNGIWKVCKQNICNFSGDEIPFRITQSFNYQPDKAILGMGNLPYP